ncbi:MAG TPA: hypothetical protein VGC00_10420 [Thermoanaerobaculia bacterium]
MRSRRVARVAGGGLVLGVVAAGALEIAVPYPEGLASGPLDGRLLVVIAAGEGPEPRFRTGGSFRAAQLFGIDVAGWSAGERQGVKASTFGYPIASLGEVPAGEYTIQAVFHRYERLTPAHGKTVLLPWDRGEGQQWNRAPGNLISAPRAVALDPSAPETLEIALDSVIPPVAPPADTRYVRHVRMRSELLSRFWGREVELGAHVLVPAGFDDHPEARFPLIIFHGHFPSDFGGFRETPPDPDLECERSERFQVDCYNRIQQQEAYDLFRQWTSPGFPRFLVVEIQHPTPFYDDSYGVNSANNGPYGDAVTFELIPDIERRFRGLGAWSRFLYGGSTGGWEALAAQIFYPDEYSGAFGACPDPVDFRAFELVNLYADVNAYSERGPFASVPRPSHRNHLGEIDTLFAGENHWELALGTRGRSGQQFDGWQSVYSPVGEDGYPRPIFDKSSGEIDREVAAYWRENYDLRHILERDWATLGPKLRGKLHVYCGDMDNYYLNNAVYLLEEFLRRAEPPADAFVDYGDRAGHCWNGDHENPIWISRLRYNTFYLPRILERLATAAPAGADLSSWRY